MHSMFLLFDELFKLLVFVDDRVSEELVVNYVVTPNDRTIILLLLLQQVLMHLSSCVIMRRACSFDHCLVVR